MQQKFYGLPHTPNTVRPSQGESESHSPVTYNTAPEGLLHFLNCLVKLDFPPEGSPLPYMQLKAMSHQNQQPIRTHFFPSKILKCFYIYIFETTFLYNLRCFHCETSHKTFPKLLFFLLPRQLDLFYSDAAAFRGLNLTFKAH